MIRISENGFFKNENKAQAAAELAIFGAILIFVIGIIVRTGLNIGTSMNTNLRVLRYALSESYRTSERQYTCDRRDGSPCHDSAARNSASILILEDRLSVNSGQKTGSRDRVPYIAFGSATRNHNLFLPVDDGETWSMPVYDMFINGQRFPFRISSTSTFILDDPSLPDCPFLPGPGGDPRCWEPNCLNAVPGPGVEGCPVVYKIISNGSPEWCTDTAPGPLCLTSGSLCSTNMSGDERFDLDFDGVTDITAVEPDVNGDCLRDSFSWQWIAVPVVPESREGDLILDGPILRENSTADVDGDNRDELVSDLSYLPGPSISARVRVYYKNKGEIDLSGRDGGETGLKTEDMQMFSFVRDTDNSSPLGMGTYLRIEEGQLFGAGSGQFIRSTTRQDSVDVVQRRIVLRSTGDCNSAGPVERFCTTSTTDLSDPACTVTGVRAWGASNWTADNALYDLENPVEVCVPPPIAPNPHECFTPMNMYRTCLQWGDATTSPTIFVRSRIQDLRGRRWITRFE
jgi:hypothetical protein